MAFRQGRQQLVNIAALLLQKMLLSLRLTQWP